MLDLWLKMMFSNEKINIRSVNWYVTMYSRIAQMSKSISHLYASNTMTHLHYRTLHLDSHGDSETFNCNVK